MFEDKRIYYIFTCAMVKVQQHEQRLHYYHIGKYSRYELQLQSFKDISFLAELGSRFNEIFNSLKGKLHVQGRQKVSKSKDLHCIKFILPFCLSFMVVTKIFIIICSSKDSLEG